MGLTHHVQTEVVEFMNGQFVSGVSHLEIYVPLLSNCTKKQLYLFQLFALKPHIVWFSLDLDIADLINNWQKNYRPHMSRPDCTW